MSTIKNISIIVAVGNDFAIGLENKLLWHLPADLKRFKKITSGHKIIMGRNTFLSLPKGALPNRTNIVISDKENERFEDCVMASSPEKALELAGIHEEVFVIGGGSIYKQFLPHTSRIYLTRVHADFKADTYFPELKGENWRETEHEDFPADEKHKYPYSFHIYDRI